MASVRSFSFSFVFFPSCFKCKTVIIAQSDGPMNLQFKCKCKWCNSNRPQSCTEDNMDEKNDNTNKMPATAAAKNDFVKKERKKEGTKWNEMKQIRVKQTGPQSKQQKQKFIVIDAYLFCINRNLPQLLLLLLKEKPDRARWKAWIECSFVAVATHNISQYMTRRCRSLFFSWVRHLQFKRIDFNSN